MIDAAHLGLDKEERIRFRRGLTEPEGYERNGRTNTDMPGASAPSVRVPFSCTFCKTEQY